MKLYYTPGACSLASHIVAVEAGLALTLVKVDLATRTTEGGGDFSAINPKGYVPALELDDGDGLTEGVAIMQFLADLAPQSGLVPPAGSRARYHQQEWLTFISSEVHKGFRPFWNPTIPNEVKEAARGRLANRFRWMETQLAGRAYLTGDSFTAADAYAFTVINWSGLHAIDLTPYPNLCGFMDRVRARPKVQQALREEGLI